MPVLDSPTTTLCGLNEDHLGVLVGDNGDGTLVNDRDPVADGETMAIHFHHAACGSEIGVSSSVKSVINAAVREKQGAQDAGIRANR